MFKKEKKKNAAETCKETPIFEELDLYLWALCAVCAMHSYMNSFNAQLYEQF